MEVPVLVLALVFIAQTATAPAPPSSSSPSTADTAVQEPDRVVYRQTTSLVFTGADVDGKGEKPTYGLVKEGPKTHFRNLIELRSSFRSELKASRDAL